MAATTSTQSITDNFNPKIHGVDHSTGKFCSFLPIANLIGNNGLGPNLDFALHYSPETNESEFGNWNLRFNCAQYYEGQTTLESRGTLTLENGQTWKWSRSSVISLPNALIVYDSNSKTLRITHNDGKHELLSAFTSNLLGTSITYYLPTALFTASGNSLSLTWEIDPASSRLPRLTSIADESKILLKATYESFTSLNPSPQIVFDVLPGTSNHYSYTLSIQNLTDPGRKFLHTRHLIKAQRSDLNQSIHFEHLHVPAPRSATYNISIINKITRDSGLIETLTYSSNRVSNHTITDNQLVPVQNNSYTYKSIQGDFITSVTETGNRVTDYRFTKDRLPIKETAWVNDVLLKTIEIFRLSKNGNTALTGAKGDPLPDRLETTTVTTYFSPTLSSRSESVIVTFDTLGNITSKTEEGITTEWTYYRGLPKEEDKLVRIDQVHTATTPVSIIAGILDYANPVGWAFLLFGKAGLTWGTREIRQTTNSPWPTLHNKNVFNLPIDIECPGDPNYFKVHVESEKVYTFTNGQRTDLKWTFYSYNKLPVKSGNVKGPTLRPSKKLTIYNPDIDASGKLSKTAGVRMKMVLEENTYDTNTASPHHGRLLHSKQSILEGNGSTVAGSDITTTVSYTLNNDLLTTTTSVVAGSTPALIQTQSIDVLTGRLMEETDAQENRTTYLYDPRGRISQQTLYADEPKLRGTTTFNYVDSATETSMTRTSPFGEQSKDIFDALGRPIRNQWLHVDNSWMTLYEIAYDSQGREASATLYDYAADKTPLQPQTRHFTYDQWGQLSQIKWAVSGETENFYYDPATRHSSAWLGQGNDTVGQTALLFDEPGGALRQEIYLHANGERKTSQTRRYDAAKRLITASSSEKLETRLTYDAFGRISQLETAGITTVNDFPAHSQVPVASAARLESAGTIVSLGTQTVDGLGRVAASSIGGKTVNYAYIGTGLWGRSDTLPSALRNSTQPIALSAAWDSQTRTITETLTGGVVRNSATTTSQATYEYSIQGLLLRCVDAFGNSTQYTYDANGRLQNSTSSTLTVDFKYDPLGRLASETMNDLTSGKTMVTTYIYDALGQEIQRTFSATNFQTITLKTTYSKSLISSMEVLQGQTSLRKENYQYNNREQLSDYTCTGSQKPYTPDGHPIDQETFTYDIAGNLTQCTLTSNGNVFTDTYAFGSIDPCQPQSSTRVRGNTQQTLSYQHDSLGYLINNTGMTLTYNTGGQLTSCIQAQRDLEYHYDNLGRLAGCTGTGYYDQYYYKDDLQYARQGVFITNGITNYRTSVLLNQSSSCLLLQQSLHQGSGSTPVTSRSFEIKDVKGSVIGSYDLVANQISLFNYTPFGYHSHTLDQRSWVGYNGEPIDRVFGFYHLGNGTRVYDPAKRSFNAADPISPFGAGGANRYCYCSNDPINKSDPSGLAEVANQYSVISHAPAIEDPVVTAALVGGIGIALAPFTGGASVGWTVAAVGLATVSAGFGVASAALRESDPTLSQSLDWASFGTGLGEVGLGLGMAFSTAKTASLGITKKTSLVYKHSRIGRGQMGVEHLTVQTRNTASHNGVTSYEVYSGGPKTRVALIEGHGMPRAERFRFRLPPGTDFFFYAPKGAKIYATERRFVQHVSRRLAPSTYVSRPHNALRPKLTPDYILSEFKPKDLVAVGILRTQQDLERVMTQFAVAHNIDIIRPKGDIPLSELITSLQSQNYRQIYGSFCRGPIIEEVGLSEIKRIRNSKWRTFIAEWEDFFSSLV